MPDFSFLLLYVTDHAASARLYSALLKIPIVEQMADITLLPLKDGVMLGLWSKTKVEPINTGQSGGSEVAFTVADAAAVQAMHDDWQRRGLPIIQSPTQMSFGMTFVALDPDGHRLRVFAPAAA